MNESDQERSRDLREKVRKDLDQWKAFKTKRDFVKNIECDTEIVATYIETVLFQSSTQFVVQTLRNQVAKEYLRRDQLLCLTRTGIRIWHFFTNKLEGGEEDAEEVQGIVVSLLSKLKLSRWFDMAAKELSIVQHIVDEIHNIPAFMGNIMKDLLQKKNEAEENASNPVTIEKDINIDQIETKIDSIMSKLDLLPSLSVRSDQSQRITLKLSMVNKAIEIRKATENLEATVHELKAMTTKQNIETVPESDVDVIDQKLRSCRSVEDIEQKVPEFEYFEQDEKFKCVVCDETFSYQNSLQNDFTDEKLSMKFRNLKKNLKSHIKESFKHSTAIRNAATQETLEAKEDCRNRQIGMNLGRLSYGLLYKGRPNSDFPDQVSIAAKNKTDVGDINHSKQYVRKFGTVVADVVRTRMKTYLSTPLKSSGCLPPVKILADKGTHMHVTRQVI